MDVKLTIRIPDEGDNAPADGMPTSDEVREHLEHLFRFEDVIPWYGEVSLNESAQSERDLRTALEGMLDLIVSGRHYQTQNPYTRPEVDAAYKALGRDWRHEA